MASIAQGFNGITQGLLPSTGDDHVGTGQHHTPSNVEANATAPTGY
jgi:hypothetical protein